jgi:tRNA pseudouridine13 synthase
VKVKRKPEDFRVEELCALEPARRGAHGFYRLDKRNLSTFEAIEMLARHLGRPARTIRAGGLKDKYALTSQHLTIAGKPVGKVKLRGMTLTPLGRCDRPMTGALLKGNRFKLVLRDLPAASVDLVGERAALVGRQGLPNYFDEQRFGSLRGGEGFIARKLMDGDHEGALRLHLAAPSRLDAPKRRAQRKRLAALWGRWDQAFAALPRGNDRSVVNYLRDHPEGFTRAFELIEGRLAQLYLFAYQSYLWNQILAGLIRRRLPEESLFEVRYAPGKLTFFDEVAPGAIEEIAGPELDLPSRKAAYPEGPIAEAAGEVLAAEGIVLDDFRLKGMRKLRFRAGRRLTLIKPCGLRCHPARPDDIYSGKRKLQLDFELPPGSYATLVVKCVGRDLLPGSRASRQAGGSRSSHR